jgi:hypothetical protein
MTAPPVRIFLLLRFAALAQIIMLSMSIVFPLVVVDGFLRTATRRDYGRSYRHYEQEWSEVLKQRPHDNSPPERMIPSRSKNEPCPSAPVFLDCPSILWPLCPSHCLSKWYILIWYGLISPQITPLPGSGLLGLCGCRIPTSKNAERVRSCQPDARFQPRFGLILWVPAA